MTMKPTRMIVRIAPKSIRMPAVPNIWTSVLDTVVFRDF
jgi:hypothetical protein